MKKLRIHLFGGLLASLLISGCAAAPDLENLDFKSSTGKIYELEASSYLMDLDLFYDLQEQSLSGQKSDDIEEKQLVLLNYADQVYSLASARVEADLENLDEHSQDYRNYLMLLEAYCELYFQEREELPSTLKDGKSDSSPLLASLQQIEQYYQSLGQQLQ